MSASRVLIVDDDAFVRTLLATLLEHAGYTAELAETGQAAVEKLRRNFYPAILLDLMLPGINGFEIMRFLKSDRPELLKHVIVVTAAANQTLEHFTDRDDIFSLVRKPFDIADLVNQVRACAAQNGHSNSAR